MKVVALMGNGNVNRAVVVGVTGRLWAWWVMGEVVRVVVGRRRGRGGGGGVEAVVLWVAMGLMGKWGDADGGRGGEARDGGDREVLEAWWS